MYIDNYDARMGIKIMYSFKDVRKTLTREAKVLKEYPFFILLEVKGNGGKYRTCINKTDLFTKEVVIAI